MKRLLLPFKLCMVLLPWFLKRPLLNRFFGYQLAKSARIGLAWVFPENLIMKEHAQISHFCVAIHLRTITLSEDSRIGRNNWITGYPAGSKKHFTHITHRAPDLELGVGSAITKNHHIDCTEKITIGDYTIIAGYQSQLLTHSINIELSRQDAAPISIGDYCFVGTNSVILGGARLPSYSVLGAKSLLNQAFEEPYRLIAGVPAKEIKSLDPDFAYFKRIRGFVD
jgi:acetyltransferase-like isoleucine patch superfamily enzyme